MYRLWHLMTILGISAGVRQRNPKVKIACVGDSITAGFPFDSSRGNAPEVSGYPWHLQQILGPETHEVVNFGKGETTVIPGSKSYESSWYNATLEKAIEFKPEIVLLMFGANDVKENRLKKFYGDFDDAYAKLIGRFQGKGDFPSIYLLIPPPMYDNDIYGPEFRPPGRAGGMQQDVYNQLLPKKLRKIAQQTEVKVIDLPSCFLKHASCEDVTVNCCDWEARKPPKRRGDDEVLAASSACAAHEDAIHPNDEGYKNIAEMVKHVILDGCPPCP